MKIHWNVNETFVDIMRTEKHENIMVQGPFKENSWRIQEGSKKDSRRIQERSKKDPRRIQEGSKKDPRRIHELTLIIGRVCYLQSRMHIFKESRRLERCSKSKLSVVVAQCCSFQQFSTYCAVSNSWKQFGIFLRFF